MGSIILTIFLDVIKEEQDKLVEKNVKYQTLQWFKGHLGIFLSQKVLPKIHHGLNTSWKPFYRYLLTLY